MENLSKLTPRQKLDLLLYNLLPGDREKIAQAQGGVDPITGSALSPLANVDHDHKTGLVRGLLNPMTNKFLNDNLQQVMNTCVYLQSPPAVKALGRVYGLLGKAQRKKKMRYGPDGGPTPHERS